MMIGFGSGTKYKDTLLVAYMAPLFPILCGIGAIIMRDVRVRMP